jgi:hypothetical protein
LIETIVEVAPKQDRAAIDHCQLHIIAAALERDIGRIDVIQDQTIVLALDHALGDRILPITRGVDIGIVAAIAVQQIVASAASQCLRQAEPDDRIVARRAGIGQHHGAQVHSIPSANAI